MKTVSKKVENHKGRELVKFKQKYIFYFSLYFVNFL